jgi:hypothetical protein
LVGFAEKVGFAEEAILRAYQHNGCIRQAKVYINIDLDKPGAKPEL